MTRGDLTVTKAIVHPYLESKDADRIKNRDILGDGKNLGAKNVTSSLADENLNTHRKSQLTKVEKKQLTDWKFIFNTSKDTIEQHFDRRVSQLFMQAVLCYHTDYVFREGHTIHQGLGAHHIGNVKFNAAHPATVPCLYALSKTTNKEVVFLYRSGFYDESNATIDLVKQVNDADRAIDEKTKTSRLREKTVKLLNKAANGELTPPEIIKEFIRVSIIEIDKAMKKETDQVVDVLKHYRKRAEYLMDYVEEDGNIDRWLDLRLDDPFIVKPGITNRRLIRKKIDDLPVIIHNQRHQNKKESHIPSHFQDLYQHRVLSQFEDEELKVVEKALGKKFKDLVRTVDTFAYVNKTNMLIDEHVEKIDELAQEILLLTAENQNEPVREEYLSLSHEKASCLRPTLYHLRYKMITCDQEIQGAIKRLFDKTLNSIKNGSRAQHFEDFFDHTLLSCASTHSDRLILGKLLNISPTELKQKIRELKVNQKAYTAISGYARELSHVSNLIKKNELSDKKLKEKIDEVVGLVASESGIHRTTIRKLCFRRLYDLADTSDEKDLLEDLIGSEKSIDEWIIQNSNETPAEKIISQKTKEIKSIVTTAFRKIAELNEKTNAYKSELLLELRNANGMTQEDLADRYSKKFKPFYMNRQHIIEYEKGRKTISWEIAKQFAKMFGISPTLFFPSHFAEQPT